MKISWYPGHMHKAKKELKQTLGTTRAVIELLDARAPNASCNPLLAELAADLPVIKVLNKCDLADGRLTAAWIQHLQQSPSTLCLTAELDKQQLRDTVLAALGRLCPDATGDPIPHKHCLVMGIPNVGKSTVINAIVGRKATKTGNEPAVTRAQQRIRLTEHWTLIDSPGMLWPNLEDQRGALCLALTGAIRQTALDIEDVGWQSAELLGRIAPEALLSRYRMRELPPDTETLMAAIASGIGARGRAGSVDWHKTAEAILSDFRSGRLGRISLEAPAE